MRVDPLHVIEAAYDDAPNEKAWLRKVVDAISPILDDGLGLLAHTYTLRAGRRPSMDTFVCSDGIADGEGHLQIPGQGAGE